jgi:hypothetical protein
VRANSAKFRGKAGGSVQRFPGGWTATQRASGMIPSETCEPRLPGLTLFFFARADPGMASGRSPIALVVRSGELEADLSNKHAP